MMQTQAGGGKARAQTPNSIEQLQNFRLAEFSHSGELGNLSLLFFIFLLL